MPLSHRNTMLLCGSAAAATAILAIWRSGLLSASSELDRMKQAHASGVNAGQRP